MEQVIPVVWARHNYSIYARVFCNKVIVILVSIKNRKD